MTACEHQHFLKKPVGEIRDAKLRCMRCGNFSAGSPMCDECAREVMKEVEARRWRMQFVFYSIIFMGVLAYYFVL